MKKYILLFLAVIGASLTLMSQTDSRAYIRNAIRDWGECRNVAITKTNGDIALYGRNGCARSNVPASLNRVIGQLHDDGEYIDDIQLTENGRWLVLYGDNGLKWDKLPSALEKKLREYNRNKEVITTVTFNDDGDWIVITTKHFCSSNDGESDWLEDCLEKYGALWTACLTDDGLVAVYEKGYKYLGNVPDDLKKALRDSDLDVYRLKIAGGSWFFADKDGNYHYNM